MDHALQVRQWMMTVLYFYIYICVCVCVCLWMNECVDIACNTPTNTPSGADGTSWNCAEGTLYGQTPCTFTCAAGYIGSGYTFICGSDGSWSQTGSCTASSYTCAVMSFVDMDVAMCMTCVFDLPCS